MWPFKKNQQLPKKEKPSYFLPTISNNGFKLEEVNNQGVISKAGELKPGTIVKLIFNVESDGIGNETGVYPEKMWVIVKEVYPNFIIGILDSQSIYNCKLGPTEIITFTPAYITAIGDFVDINPDKFKEYQDKVRIHQRVHFLTTMLRGSNEVYFKSIRDKLVQKGIDVSKAVLAEIFQDDTAFEFGILVISKTQVVQFGYNYLHKDFSQGEFSEWNDVSSTSTTGPYNEEIKVGLEYFK